MDVEIKAEEIAAAFCYSTTALGNGRNTEICDIVLVNPDSFDPAVRLILQLKSVG